jgi:hypothetical protein
MCERALAWPDIHSHWVDVRACARVAVESIGGAALGAAEQGDFGWLHFLRALVEASDGAAGSRHSGAHVIMSACLDDGGMMKQAAASTVYPRE